MSVLPDWMYALPRTAEVCRLHQENYREIRGVTEVCLSCHEDRTLEHLKQARVTLEILDSRDLTHLDEGAPL